MNLENNNPESEIQNDFDKQRLIDLSFFSEVLGNNTELAQEILDPIFKEVLGEQLGKVTTVTIQVETFPDQYNSILNAIIETNDKVINLIVQNDEPLKMHYLDYYYSSYFIDNLQFNEEEIEYPNRDFYQIVLSNKDCIGRCNMVEVIRPKNEDNVVISSNPTRVFLYTDGKNYDKERYKDTEILLEDFVENNPKKVKNPVLRNIHKAVKEKGEYQMQLTESMKRELERMRAQDKKTIEDQRKQLELKDKEIRELKRQLGLAF